MKTKNLVVLLSMISVATLFLYSYQSLGVEVNYSRSQGSTLVTSKVSAKQKFDNSRVSVAASSSKDSSTSVNDDSSSYVKIGYKYKFTNSDSFAVDIKKSDDFYYYDSFGGAVKYSTHFKNTKLNFKLDSYTRTYSKDKSEGFNANSAMIGFDQDFAKYFTVGADYAKYFYSSRGTQTSQAFKDQSVQSSDITNTISGLVDNTISVYIETNITDFTFGVSYGTDTPKLPSSNRSNTTEVYADWQCLDQLDLNLSFSRGRTEDSTANSDTTSIGIGYSF